MGALKMEESIYRLEIYQDVLLHTVFLKVYCHVLDDIVYDVTVYLRLHWGINWDSEVTDRKMGRGYLC